MWLMCILYFKVFLSLTNLYCLNSPSRESFGKYLDSIMLTSFCVMLTSGDPYKERFGYFAFIGTLEYPQTHIWNKLANEC